MKYKYVLVNPLNLRLVISQHRTISGMANYQKRWGGYPRMRMNDGELVALSEIDMQTYYDHK